jgi:hypothetical protein
MFAGILSLIARLPAPSVRGTGSNDATGDNGDGVPRARFSVSAHGFDRRLPNVERDLRLPSAPHGRADVGARRGGGLRWGLPATATDRVLAEMLVAGSGTNKAPGARPSAIGPIDITSGGARRYPDAAVSGIPTTRAGRLGYSRWCGLYGRLRPASRRTSSRRAPAPTMGRPEVAPAGGIGWETGRLAVGLPARRHGF